MVRGSSSERVVAAFVALNCASCTARTLADAPGVAETGSPTSADASASGATTQSTSSTGLTSSETAGSGGTATGDDGSSEGTTLATTGTTTGAGCQGVCGDGCLEGDEQCDDGNEIADDGCTATCQLVPHAWELIFDDRFIRTVAVGPGGRIVAGGAAPLVPDGDLWVGAYTPGGQELWSLLESGDTNLGDEAKRLAISPDGTIAVAGFLDGNGEQGTGWVARLGADGDILWSQAHGLLANGVAAGPNTVAVAFLTESETHVRSLTADGADLLWTWTALEYPTDLAIAADGSLLVGLFGAGGLVQSLDTDGAVQWSAPAAQWFVSVASGPAGETVVASARDMAQQCDIVVAKLDAEGQELWSVDLGPLQCSSQSDDNGGVAVDPTGHIVVTFNLANPGSRVWKLDPDGGPVWEVIEPDWRIWDVGVDATGSPVIAAWSWGDIGSGLLRRMLP